jgi:hypothetical protein
MTGGPRGAVKTRNGDNRDRPSGRRHSGCVAVLALALAAWPAAASSSLEDGFARPPADARPEVFWDWMGGLISRDGITKDLEALAGQGVGGVMIMQMPDQCPYPRQWSFRDYPGKATVLGDDYFALLDHAVAETSRLGLNLALFISPGWSHCGGTWVTPDKGLKKLAWTQTPVTGPGALPSRLPRPPVSPGQGGGNVIPPWNRDHDRLPQPRDNFYRDEAVLAVPEAAPGTVTPTSSIVDLTSRMDAQGRVDWAVPAGKWTIWRLAVVSENGLNHPAPAVASGLECDRMDPAAVEQVFNGLVGRVLREARKKGHGSFKRFETDSYEAGYQDFGVDFRREFQARRAYDATPWLPAWADPQLELGAPGLAARFRADMTRTISELWFERFHATLRRLADENGLEWMTEPYWGVNLDWTRVGGRSSMPGSEVWVGGDTFLGTGPEIAALYGQKRAWAEAFTAESYESAWRNDPWRLKPFGDLAFARGVNHVFMHGFVHNPFGDDVQPGLTMGYWGTQLSRHVTWWHLSRPWHEYLARCQYLLQQGRPSHDLLVYPPSMSWLVRVSDDPYRPVSLTDEVLAQLRVREGRLVTPHGGEFIALTLRPGEPIRPWALAHVARLVQDGATLIGEPPPPRSPSLEGYPGCDAEVKTSIARLWGEDTGDGPQVRRLGKGQVVWGDTQEAAVLRAVGRADVEARRLDRPDTAAALRSAHRVIEGEGSSRNAKRTVTHLFFLTHQSNEPAAVEVSFRVAEAVPQWWNPLTGTRHAIVGYRHDQGRTIVPLSLGPYESGFVVFGAAAQGLRPMDCATEEAGRVAGPWQVSFDPRWGGPAQVTWGELQDWSRHSAAGLRYYSGTAIYRHRFSADASLRRDARYLDLGTVKNLARVRLNGRELGVAWCAPFRVAVPAELLREAANELEITVVNTWVNRLIGDEQEPEDCELEPGNPDGDRKGSYDIRVPSRGLKDLPDWFVEHKPRPSPGRLTFTSWRFYDHAAPLQPAGLLGPVTWQH